MFGRFSVVTLCGSTRFVDTFNSWQKYLTYKGFIVLSIEIVTSQTIDKDPQYNNSKLKSMLDEMHFRKIDVSDWVFVLNVGGYIGQSTKQEIVYAESVGKLIKYLEDIN